LTERNIIQGSMIVFVQKTICYTAV